MGNKSVRGGGGNAQTHLQFKGEKRNWCNDVLDGTAGNVNASYCVKL